MKDFLFLYLSLLLGGLAFAIACFFIAYWAGLLRQFGLAPRSEPELRVTDSLRPLGGIAANAASFACFGFFISHVSVSNVLVQSGEPAAQLGGVSYELTFSGMQDIVTAKDDQTSWHKATGVSELSSSYTEARLLDHQSTMMLR
jgi:hypothetical protein